MSVGFEATVPDSENAVYVVNVWRSANGEYGARVYAGFKTGELPQLDERYYEGEEELRLNSVTEVTVSGEGAASGKVPAEVSEFQPGEHKVPVRGHFITARTDPSSLKEEADKFNLPGGSDAQARQAVILGRSTAVQFVRMLPQTPPSFVIEQAFSAALPRERKRLDVSL